MLRVPDPVEHRIAHQHVGMRHVDLRPQHLSPVGEFAGPHAPEQVEVLLDRAVAVRAGAARFGHGTTVLADLLLTQAVHVGSTLLDQVRGVLVEPLEIIRGMKQLVAPVEPQPLHV